MRVVARTVMQAVSRDYGCFITSAGSHRRCGRGGGRGAGLGRPGPRGARAARRHRRRDLAGRHQVRVRRTGRASTLQHGRVTRDLDRGRGGGLVMMRRAFTSCGKRGRAERTSGDVYHRGRGSDRHRAARDRRRVRRADRRIGRANCCWHTGGVCCSRSFEGRPCVREGGSAGGVARWSRAEHHVMTSRGWEDSGERGRREKRETEKPDERESNDRGTVQRRFFLWRWFGNKVQFSINIVFSCAIFRYIYIYIRQDHRSARVTVKIRCDERRVRKDKCIFSSFAAVIAMYAKQN